MRCAVGQMYSLVSLAANSNSRTCQLWDLKPIVSLLIFHSSKRVIGEGNGNPLQYSCLENFMDKEPGGLQPMGSQRVGHSWATNANSVITVVSQNFAKIVGSSTCQASGVKSVTKIDA